MKKFRCVTPFFPDFLLSSSSMTFKKITFIPLAEIERRLSADALRAVFDHLHGQGQCEWLDGKEKNTCLIYWKTPIEWGNLIYNWAVNSGNTDTVCTIFELTEGDDVSGLVDLRPCFFNRLHHLSRLILINRTVL